MVMVVQLDRQSALIFFQTHVEYRRVLIWNDVETYQFHMCMN